MYRLFYRQIPNANSRGNQQHQIAIGRGMSTYEAAGVSIDAGDRAVELMKASIAKAQRPEVYGGIGGFAGLFDASALKKFQRPLLATSTDGVGTKTEIARQLGIYNSIGEDLVAMVVDDLVVCGAEPLFLTDYIAVGKVIPERVADIVSGIARGCAKARTALIGGETAEHPQLLKEDEFDIAGAATGVVEESKLLGAEKLEVGDVAIAIASSGVHANGFSLVRHIIKENKLSLEKEISDLGKTLGEALLTPTTIYAADLLDLINQVEVHAMAHITGGGLAANTERVLPKTMHLTIDRSTWQLPPLFSYLQRVGSVPANDLERTFNCGVGMVVLAPAKSVTPALELLRRQGHQAWELGEIEPATGGSGAIPGGQGGVKLEGSFQTR
jgi:phosphoribosylformylglycinamidine cyclo-ligase